MRRAAEPPQAECVAISSEDYPKQIVDLLGRLREAGRFEVRPAAEEAESTPRIVRYIGYERVD